MALIEKQFPLKISEKPQKKTIPKTSVDSDDEMLELDIIERLRSNLQTLNALQLRLGFMNREIESVLGLDSDK